MPNSKNEDFNPLIPSELALSGTFRRYDANKNGKLEMEELLAFLPVEDNIIFR